MAGHKSPIPPGAMVRVGLENLNEGRFLEQANREMRRMFRELAEYEKETGDASGAAVLTIKVKGKRLKGSQDHMEIGYSFIKSTPAPKRSTLAKQAGGHLLTQPVGTNDEPEQMVMFDAKGRLIAGTDEDTGETAEEPHPVAGTIGVAVNQ